MICVKSFILYMFESISLLFKGLLLLGFSFYLFKKISIPICLSINKTKEQSSKNTTLTLTKILPKKIRQLSC